MATRTSGLFPVVLSGGSGSRLWPLSRQAYPKHLLSLFGEGSLLQAAAERVGDRTLFEPLTIVTSDEHRFVIAEQLRAIGCNDAHIISEPVGRNTAAAVAVAALHLACRDPEAVLLLMPADHLIKDTAAFHDCVERGVEGAKAGRIVLFGVPATEPVEGYGYIGCTDAPTADGCLPITCFVEKPDAATARGYVEQGTYYWNCGIVIATAATLLKELERLAPDVLAACLAALDGSSDGSGFSRLALAAFAACPSVAFDVAVIEKTDLAALVPARFDWADLGSWSAIWGAAGKDDRGTVLHGDVLAQDTSGCYVRSDGPLVSVVGVENLIVVATPDAVLVMPKHRDQEVKALVTALSARGHVAASQTPKVRRPWGSYQSIETGDRFQVKRITVNPGGKLSLQRHYHRAEHWVVVRGTALVRRDNDEILLRENESIFIPLGAVHRLENPGKVPLDLIEVQSGTYLAEDDIVRLEDIYERC
ncbi:alginate biosynthesis protein AlgA [Azorhizobium oxalatiphilum]|uniref:mannose-1-phosphate guanylyltransferase n=1 Tax=Azorhizobium oxalatiphilum TaxID=980631 RepID=A0A917F8Z0_9HYPH|nr:mannose-1-phosphate guanylyltransferase/mannose-6-phosphate isomerase [Azorhizobium oxalatiphilum]GGF54329.1 alginate biosynthesis protein AlgA [Azorhizobium oxalatiphilum]